MARTGGDVEALSERIFEGAIATVELATIHLGLRLGLYQALRELGPATSSQLAELTGHDERYVREWLEQQGVAQLLICHDDHAAPEERRYELSPTAVAVLLDPASSGYLGPISHLAVGTVLTLPALEDAYRTGGGVPFRDYGSEVRDGLGLLNGATFDRELGSWIRALPDIDRRLRTGDDPRVLDIGSGTGRSSIAMARAYPRAHVHGIDLDAASVETARVGAARAGIADRVTFTVADAAERSIEPHSYDLAMILEVLHDLGDPVGTLAAVHQALRPDGAVLVADQLTRDHYAADGDPLERFQYGCSVLHCLPATRAEDPVIAHGTVIRASTVDAWAREAGFPGAQVLDVEDPFWRFYRL